MEKKIMKSNFVKLLINSLKGKKNWFFFSTVIIFVTTLIIPYILKVDEEFFTLFGIVESFVLIYVNCLIDFSFLHNDSKLAYYKSKPVSFNKQISIHIISNIIFMSYLLLLLILSVVFQDLSYEILESFRFLVPWLLVGIFLAALSSILTGNTIMAGIMTIFNFALPAIIYLIILFVFTILENIVAGFSANVLMNTFIDKFYNLEYIYFVEYSNISIDYKYIAILGIILIGLTLIIKNSIKRRKNENTGSYMVFDGYKYFVSVLASLIVPAAFSIMSYRNSVLNKILVSAIMCILSYYIIIAILEKTFKISRFSIKLFMGCMAVFIAITGGTVAVANRFKNYIPDLEDVKMAYVGNNTWVFNDFYNGKQPQYEDILNIQIQDGIIIYTEDDSINNIIELHHELLQNQSYNNSNYYMGDIVIAYWMKDGDFIIRDYKLDTTESAGNGQDRKDEIASEIVNSQELKEKKYYYLFNEDYFNNKNIYINVRSIDNYDLIINLNLDQIRDILIKDIDKTLVEEKNSFEYLIYHSNMYSFGKERENGKYIIEIVDRTNDFQEKAIGEMIIYDDFTNTIEFLEKLK